MAKKDVTGLTDEEALKERKRLRRINAALIGFFVGIVIWSIVKNTWGFLTLIPLFFSYKLVNNSKKDKEV